MIFYRMTYMICGAREVCFFFSYKEMLDFVAFFESDPDFQYCDYWECDL